MLGLIYFPLGEEYIVSGFKRETFRLPMLEIDSWYLGTRFDTLVNIPESYALFIWRSLFSCMEYEEFERCILFSTNSLPLIGQMSSWLASIATCGRYI